MLSDVLAPPPGYVEPIVEVEEVQAEETTQPDLSPEDRARQVADALKDVELTLTDIEMTWLGAYYEGLKDAGGKKKAKKTTRQGAPTGKGKRLVQTRDPARLGVYLSERTNLPGVPADAVYTGPYRAKVGYAKLGRTIDLDPEEWGQNGGDNEPPVLLNKLALRNPDVQFVLVGKNSGETPQEMGLPENVINPWTEWKPIVAEANRGGKASDRQYAQDKLDEVTRGTFLALDGIVVWAGQHGTSNSRIPTVDDRAIFTEPQISFIHYGSFIVRGINAWRSVDPLNREEVWLVPDARNYIKARDFQWPTQHPLLSQYDWTRPDKLERYDSEGSPSDWGFSGAFQIAEGLWQAPYQYKYSRLEVVGIPSDVEFNDDFEGREHFGIIINEARNYVKHDRLTALKDYVLPLAPAFIHGRWTATSMKTLDMEIEALHYSKVLEKVKTVKTTLTTPSSGSGWATTKAWESFAVGTVCFFHPEYDTQGHIIPTLDQVARGDVDGDIELKALAQWLRVRTPEDLAKRVELLNTDEKSWRWIVQAQRRYFDRAVQDQQCINHIEARLGLREEDSE